jgi:hypothetical protein
MLFYLYFIKNNANYLKLFWEIIAATFLLLAVASNGPKLFFLGLFNSESNRIVRNVGSSNLNDLV